MQVRKGEVRGDGASGVPDGEPEGGRHGCPQPAGWVLRPSSWLLTVQVSDLGRRLAACELADKAGSEQGVGKEQEGTTERLLREI